ncbi:DUF6361 family protein [Isoptericola sp. NPDC019571]|uniref:DUF6361 family protein n=1 Tax=Isoptericola sp. NPDC019571 TaxID=3364008 RepID=UPI0037B27A82
MASGVAWLSFDAEQQRRTQLMLAALSSQGTVDELGLGIIRDLIARALHPGLTVLHRRAKYLLFIPRDYQHLPATSVEKMLAEGRRAEARRMKALVDHYRGHPNDGDDFGIIGRRQGELTQQLPSAMYWSLLRQLEILREPGSLADYCRRRVDAARHHAARSVLHEEGEVIEADTGPWAELPEEDLDGFALSRDEAEWLQLRFLASEHRSGDRRSLVSWLLDPTRDVWWTDVRNPWEHPDRDKFPADTAKAMYLGRDLDQFIHSARITYNYLCAMGRPDQSEKRDELIAKYEAAMDDWRASFDEQHFTSTRLTELDAWARKSLTAARVPAAAHQRWDFTYAFLRRWLTAVITTSNVLKSSAAAAVLKDRETWLKQGRARLGNPELLRAWAGDSGYFHLDYNWSIAMLICGDIHGHGKGDGLGTARRMTREIA